MPSKTVIQGLAISTDMLIPALQIEPKSSDSIQACKGLRNHLGRRGSGVQIAPPRPNLSLISSALVIRCPSISLILCLCLNRSALAWPAAPLADLDASGYLLLNFFKRSSITARY